MKTMSVYGLLGKIYNYNVDLPKRILFRDRIYELDDYNHYVYKEINNPFIPYIDLFAETLNWELDDFLHEQIAIIENDEVEILEEPKGIPEKLDMVLLGQCDNWTQKYNKDTKKMEIAHIELNPYVIDTIRENTLEIQHKFNEIIDYLESKGE